MKGRDNMTKRVYRISLLSSILLFLFGLLMILESEAFIKSISIILGALLLVIGIFPVIEYFRYKQGGLFSAVSLVSGIFSIVCGLMFLLNENMLMILIPAFIGVWMIINGINKLEVSFDLKDEKEKSWVVTFIFSILIIILGIYFIINPISGADFVMNTLGIVICVYAILDIIDCILIKIKVKKFVKDINEIDKVIDEQ
jgi:uncharacterized membrane protein HdeD (DUF308 family)